MKNLLYWLSRKIDYPVICPQVVQISLTYRCDLKCRMCSIAGLLPREEELTTRQVFHVIDEAKAYGINEVLLTGGEPFLREDFFEICNYIHDSGLRSIVTTNGVGINKESAEKVRKAGINHLHFSIDGLRDTHDFFRGAGTFDKTLCAIAILDRERKAGNSFSLGIATTIMDRNIAELFKVVELADNLNIDVVNFQPVIKDNANFLDKGSSAFGVKEEHIPIIEEEFKKIRAFRPKYVHIYEEPRLELLVKYYKGVLTHEDWVCFGGFKTVFVCYSKKEPLVYSCHGICGNLDQVSLRKAWTSKDAFRLRRNSRRCKNLCLQSCYSLEAAQNLGRAIRSLGRQEA